MVEKYRENKAATLKDVASHANVSVITASRTLRTPEIVSPEMRDRVRQAVKALGYVPNPAAQALASNRSNIIGVIIPSVANWVFAEVLSGMLDAAEKTAFEIQFVTSRYVAARETELLRVLATQRPAGVIVTGYNQTQDGRRILERMGCPVVQIMEIGPDPVDLMIGIDHAAAAGAMVEHLFEQGYRRIGFLGARMDPRSQRRLAGYRAAMGKAGLDRPERVLTTPEATSVSKGAEMLADFLALTPDLDAVFCNNGDLALGALFEAQRQGLRVPQQLGVAGFNDFDMEAAAFPSITSVRTRRYEMGCRSVEMLAAAVAGERPDPAVIDLGFEIMARQSTARLASLA